MKSKRVLHRFLAGCVAMVLMFTSCEIQENFKYESSGVDGVLGVTAWEFIQANSDFSQLRTAITRTGLQSLYQEEERTFIVPNNKAFGAYIQNSAYSSLEDIPVPILRNMLRYHIVKDRVIFTDPSIGRDLPIAYETENGQTMFLSRNNNYIGQINQGTARQWEIRTSNLEPTNGVIHAVDYIVYFSAPAVDNSSETTLEQDTIYPIADSFVAGTSPGEDYANTNYGLDPRLRPKKASAAGTGAYDRRAYLKFDLDAFDKPGITVDMRLSLKVQFSHDGGHALYLHKVNDNSWVETLITFNNAPAPVLPWIASVTTTAVATNANPPGVLNFDITNYYQNESPSGLVSFMIDAELRTSLGTTELYSRNHANIEFHPMLIKTLATGQNVLVLEINGQATVSNGGSVVVDDDLLKITGADPADIVYTIETAPAKGWFVRGADVLGQGGQFTQADLQSLSLIYIHNGESTGEDTIVLSAKDRTGVVLEDIEVKINIQ